VEYGPPEQILGNPTQAYTQSLIDAMPGKEWDRRRALEPGASA
jgi:ABC-type dipeptide/oligopeptide/nickel transport system ATPase component